MNTIKYESMFGTKYDIALSIERYVSNNNIAVQMWIVSEYGMEPYGNLTTNLDEALPYGYGFIDTNNLGETTLDWAIDNGLCEYGGRYARSGFCRYPLVKFNLDKLREYSEGV